MDGATVKTRSVNQTKRVTTPVMELFPFHSPLSHTHTQIHTELCFWSLCVCVE